MTALQHVMAFLALCLSVAVDADFQQCLGLNMDLMLTIPLCMELFSTCQSGVNELNQKLQLTALDAYKAVSIVSAYKPPATMTRRSPKVGMIVQLAPLYDCATAVVAENNDRSCNFDISRVEFYSIILALDVGVRWNLESYKRHVLSDNNRAQIVAEYNSDQVYGSKVAIAMFDARGASFELDVDESASWTRISIGVASVFVFLLCLGLGLHQHRRLLNDYVPVSGTKKKALEARSSPRSTGTDGPILPSRAEPKSN